VRKNAVLNNLVEKYLLKYPEKKRPKEEYEQLEKQNEITANSLIIKKEENKPNRIQQNVPIIQPQRQNLRRLVRNNLRDPEYIPSENEESSDSDFSEEVNNYLNENSSSSSRISSESEDSRHEDEKEDRKEDQKEDIKQCGFCNKKGNISETEYLQNRCVLCNTSACKECLLKKLCTELQSHNISNLPEICLNRNQFEQKIFIELLEKKGITPKILYEMMIKEIVKKKYTYKNSIFLIFL